MATMTQAGRVDFLKERLVELNPEARLTDGLDDALIGICRQFNRYLPVYSYKRCVWIFAKLMDEKLMWPEKLDAAREHMEFNVVGAWVGENTPVFLLDDWE